ncbi:hypothetical protein FAF40_01515 [Staphylococcus haemolyticus]|uniref:hypothetical protein n=1 Tax=Staphylococcus haemolyticus TaxID=1283 RepID=UPI0010ACC602|nr:hypothetical protein [Staphylococcus haemolyticus]HCV2365118.1 hypothetical protein [Staphylococcus aureus]MDO0971666.1 hypothetical protein [Staphylococcus haemolyticus]TJX74025.1 hypothetical protein FAF40_01515 [Staphylococcus haemolyticus]HCV6078112.1 hypothetical protein [Staphylococcus aureus]HDF1966535.1 hypothetical protein [Staphylococcus aureus]
MTREEHSYLLEQEADMQFVNMIRTLADAVDERCFIYGKLRHVDTDLLNKCIQLIKIYNHIETSRELTQALNLSFVTIKRMIQPNDTNTVNRKSVDKVISYMRKTADEIERNYQKT